MKVIACRTPKIHVGDDLYKILDTYIPFLREKTVVAITSKILSLTQGDVVAIDPLVDKKELIKKEADYYYLENRDLYDKYRTITTITNDVLIMSAGIDESNADGHYVLWPRNLQLTTNVIWRYLRRKRKLKHLGVIITDGHTTPLRWGVTGIGISWCGIKPLKKYIGGKDLFGRTIHNVNGGILDGLAASAALVMGEGNEQTPIAIISEVPFVTFTTKSPSKTELLSMKIEMKYDLYAPLLTAVKWKTAK